MGNSNVTNSNLAGTSDKQYKDYKKREQKLERDSIAIAAASSLRSSRSSKMQRNTMEWDKSFT